jgi:hypothetical protein
MYCLILTEVAVLSDDISLRFVEVMIGTTVGLSVRWLGLVAVIVARESCEETGFCRVRRIDLGLRIAFAFTRWGMLRSVAIDFVTTTGITITVL